MAMSALLLLLLLTPDHAHADLFEYHWTTLNLGNYLVRRVEMFSPKDQPADTPPGNGNAYIQLESIFFCTVNFQRKIVNDTAHMENEGEIEFATVQDHSLKIGYTHNEKHYFCCTRQLAEKINNDVCNENLINRMIILNKDVIATKKNSEVSFNSLKLTCHGEEDRFPGQQSYSFRALEKLGSSNCKRHLWVILKSRCSVQKFGITKSGPHILVMSNCDPRLSGFDVKFKGSTVWMNPYGYLPATLYYFIPFFGTMALVYGVNIVFKFVPIGGALLMYCLLLYHQALALVWLILNAIHWKDIVSLQNYITCVMAVCLIENMVLYFDYVNFNEHGRRHHFTLVLGVLVTMFRRTISRMLIMAVSIGFAIVRPDLGKNKKHIINFGLVYFCLGLTQQILIDLAKVHTNLDVSVNICLFVYVSTYKDGWMDGYISDHWRTLLAIPVAAADSGCYWFIFISLYHLITMLRVRQQLVKLAVYKTFTKVLIFSLVCATVFSCYHLYLTSTNQVIQSWRIWWFLDEGIWNILFSVIFFAICFLFRPSQSAKRYAYSQLSTDMDDEFGLEDEGAIEMDDVGEQDEPLFTLGDDDIEPVVDKKTAKID
eukprot:jgi/Bigna1/85372/estExt_fgenesh1_pg.C_30386